MKGKYEIGTLLLVFDVEGVIIGGVVGSVVGAMNIYMLIVSIEIFFILEYNHIVI